MGENKSTLKNFKEAGYLFLAALILWLLWKGCGTGIPNGQGGGDGIDTVFIKGKPDTVIIRDTVISTIIRPKPIIQYVQVFHNNDSGRAYCDTIRVYLSAVSDSLGNTAEVKDSVKGVLLSQEIRLIGTTRFISQVDTLKILTTERFRLDLMGGIAVSPLSLSPFIGMGAISGRKSGIIYYKPIQQEIGVGVGVRLF